MVTEQYNDPNGTGRWTIHAKQNCSGMCPFHCPSDHHMKNWPIFIRSSTLVERMCGHGQGHPDPDSLNYLDPHGDLLLGIHGCDKCCSTEREN